jgi:hypothetical protein
MQNWVEAGGEKAARQRWTSYLDWSRADFSGYLAVDEGYEGPFCVSSIVDHHTDKRLRYQELEHTPEHPASTAFLRRIQLALRLRGLVLRGVSTDGSPLYPEPWPTGFGDVPHQLCEFPILKELTKASLRAVAQVRKALATRQPPRKRGRPSTQAATGSESNRQLGTSLHSAPCLFSTTCLPPNSGRCTTSLAACPSCARYEQAWRKSTADSLAAVGPTRPWLSSPRYASGCAVPSTSGAW